MKKTWLCVILGLLCLLPSALCCAEEISLVDEWYVLLLPEADYDVLSRTEDGGFAFERLPYTVVINDNRDDGGIALLDEESNTVFSGGFHCYERDFFICLMPDGYDDVTVLFLEDAGEASFTTYLGEAFPAFFTPTHILANGSRDEYYYINNRLFIISGNDYLKLQTRWLSDDAFIGINTEGIERFLFIRTHN